MGMLNVLFLEIILCIVLVSKDTEACNLIQPQLLVPEWPHWPLIASLLQKGSNFITKCI